MGVAVADNLRGGHELGGLNHVVLVMIPAQVSVRSTAVKGSAKIAVLNAIAHVVKVSAYHVRRVRYARNVGLRLNATVRRTR